MAGAHQGRITRLRLTLPGSRLSPGKSDRMSRRRRTCPVLILPGQAPLFRSLRSAGLNMAGVAGFARPARRRVTATILPLGAGVEPVYGSSPAAALAQRSDVWLGRSIRASPSPFGSKRHRDDLRLPASNLFTVLILRLGGESRTIHRHRFGLRPRASGIIIKPINSLPGVGWRLRTALPTSLRCTSPAAGAVVILDECRSQSLDPEILLHAHVTGGPQAPQRRGAHPCVDAVPMSSGTDPLQKR